MQTEELLRRLALNDERAVQSATGARPAEDCWERALDRRTAALVQLGALLSVGATTAACRPAVDAARDAGATDEEIVAVLLAVGPAVGRARVVAAAPMLALAIDYDIDETDAPF